MKFSKSFLATLAVLTTLLLSGMSIPIATANSGQSSAYTFPAAPATYAGSASAFLSGPFLSNPPYDPSGSVAASSSGTTPNLNPKPLLGKVDPPASSTIPPTVSCSGFGSFTAPGCDQISTHSDGAKTNPFGLNAYNNLQNAQTLGAKYGTIEPPDQGLCTGNGYVLEVENQGVMQVFTSNLKPVSGVIALDSVMGLTAKGWSSGGDIMCQYDYANGGHWFITEFVSTTPESAGGPFVGCFAVGGSAVLDSCREGIAVSVTNNPMGSYNVYFLDPNKANGAQGDTDVGYLLNDYAKTATTRDAFMVFYDEYDDLAGPLNGVQQFAFSKNALELGSSNVNVAEENFATASNLSPIPISTAFQPFTLPGSAWYQVIPAQTTDPSEYDNNNGGTGFMVGSLDFLGYGDNRIAVFDWTHLSALNSPSCSKCGDISFGGQLLTGIATYQDEGAPCLASAYLTISTFCGLGPQKAGPIPLGDACVTRGLTSGVSSCPESGIATNGDGATQAFYANGEVWTAVSTVVNQTFWHQPSEYHLGATYWGIAVSGSHFGWGSDDSTSGVTFSIQNQGIVSAEHEDLEFPAAAATENSVLMTFTLSGNGGPTGADNGGFYPSTAYMMLSTGWGGFGFGNNVIHIADMGASPQDGFTEYQGYSATYGTLTTRPRWGDYNQAVFDPSTGRFYFATEMISHPNCGDSAFASDPTCGGTRSPSANWGNSLNSIHP